MIPSGGREVQCSNCGHAWDAYPPDEEPADAAHESAAESARPETPAAAEPRTEESRSADNEGAEPEPAAADATPRRRIDESVLGVLREEAERETRARAAERGGLESQPELGLSEAPKRRPPPLQEAPAEQTAPGHKPARSEGRGTQRGRLPDIEEINSSLRASSERAPGEPGAESIPAQNSRGRRGFRLGFGIALFVAAVALGLYVAAPELGDRVPQARPYLAEYVGSVNAMRLWVNDGIQSGMMLLTEMLRDSGG